MKHARGFTLLEVLMAVGLLALISTLVISTMSGGLRQIRWSSQASEASMHAQSLLDTIGTMEVIEPGTRQGDWEDGKFRYQLEIKEVLDPSIESDAQTSQIEAVNPPVLYQINLQVNWGSNKPQERLRFVNYKARQPEIEHIEPQI
ncbi:MAG: PulJ/GspJ family protein [Arenimonas sp.]